MVVEVMLPKLLKEKLAGLRREDMELVLHSYFVTGVLPEGVIAKMVEKNRCYQPQEATAVRFELEHLRLVEAERS